MFHRTIYLKYRQDVTQADASALLHAFHDLPHQMQGLASVSIRLMQGDFDASVALSFATEQARRSCDWSEGYRMVLTQARELCAQVETRETADAQNVPYSPQDSAAAMLPMKWHKFLIYFALLAGAILNGLNGVYAIADCFSGQYASVYEMFPAALAVDLFTALCLIGIAVFQVFTRGALARFSRKAPQMVVWLYAAQVILSVVQLVAIWLISGLSLSYIMTPGMWFILIEGALMTWANQVYYRKRAALFVN